MTVKPLTPAEVAKRHVIPDEVVEVVNGLLIVEARGQVGSIVLMQDRVATAIAVKMGVSTDEVFARGWLDFEPIFRGAGWKVDYDKPGYCETYEASWTFRAKR